MWKYEIGLEKKKKDCPCHNKAKPRKQLDESECRFGAGLSLRMEAPVSSTGVKTLLGSPERCPCMFSSATERRLFPQIGALFFFFFFARERGASICHREVGWM